MQITKLLVRGFFIAIYDVAEGVHINGVCIDGQYENHIFMALLFDVSYEAK